MRHFADESPKEWALMAKQRAEQALRRYDVLGDRWQIDPPGLVAAADVAIDAAIGLEASLKCVADQYALRKQTDRIRTVFKKLRVAGRLPTFVLNAWDPYKESIDTLFDARNAYLHGGLPAVHPRVLLGAVRDALHIQLALSKQDQLLGDEWPELDERLWRFTGQPSHFAKQVKTHFSEKTFSSVPLFVQVSRFTGGSLLAIQGGLNAVTDVEQGRWDQTGAADSLSSFLPHLKAEVGMIKPPSAESMRHAPGDEMIEGTLGLRVRDLPVGVDGFMSEENPLAAPIYLFEDETKAWMVGPGDLRLVRLDVEIPYRGTTSWLVAPGSRLEAVSQLVEYACVGKVEGELRFHYPGHRGYPAFRGTAVISGTAKAAYPGIQIAEWKHVRWNPETKEVLSWMWEGISKLEIRCKMLIQISFDQVEVFE